MTIELQIACAERELKRRRKHYPRLVDQRQLMPRTAEDEINGMIAVVLTLTNYKKMCAWMTAVATIPDAAEFAKGLP